MSVRQFDPTGTIKDCAFPYLGGAEVDPQLVAFGQRLRALRRDARLTQRELGFATGIHRVTINRLEHGGIEIGLRNLRRLATALSVSTSKLAD